MNLRYKIYIHGGLMKSRNTLIFFLGGTLLLGFLSGLLSMNSAETYAAFIRPPLSPPGILFPIVWTVLYLLMGMSAFLVYESKSSGSSQALLVYAIQLGINLLWPIFFFPLHLYLFSFIWLLLLLYFVILMTVLFYGISPLAAYLRIPYILWIIFAGYLNLGVCILNK